MAPVRDVLAEYLRSTGLAGRLRDARVFRAWREALGPALAAHAPPVRFDGAALTVEVRSAAHLHELANFTGERLRRSANERLGEERIRRVVFKVAR